MNGLEKAAQWHEREAIACEMNANNFDGYGLPKHAETYRQCVRWHRRAAKAFRDMLNGTHTEWPLHEKSSFNEGSHA